MSHLQHSSKALSEIMDTIKAHFEESNEMAVQPVTEEKKIAITESTWHGKAGLRQMMRNYLSSRSP
jgi:hypothetical protein